MPEALTKAAALKRPPFFVPWVRQLCLPALVILVALAAYHDSFSGAFFFDDELAIAHNASIRTLWPPWAALTPPGGGSTVSARPVVNLTLAVNYACGGLEVGGYHFFNLAIHTLAALALYGIVRRTLVRRPILAHDGEEEARFLGMAVALLWVAHPLQTEAVTYVVQRAESMAGLFYLLTIYCFIRGVDTARGPVWLTVSLLSCLLGMACKEIMVTAPLILLLYDRTFVAGTFRVAWQVRRSYYLLLASTWICLIWLVAGSAGRSGTAGFGSGVQWWSYALTQLRAIVIYLRLAAWPNPLVFDYGTKLVRSPFEIVPQILLVSFLAAGTVWALWRRPAVGFLGFCFFVILAPSSSFVPIATQTMAEHRMYLPLAALATAAVLALYTLFRQWGLLLCVPWVVILACLTARRNADYQSGLVLWGDTAAKCPENARAHYNFGLALYQAGRRGEATKQYEEALRLRPDYAEAHNNLGVALIEAGEIAQARAQYNAALQLKPDYAEAHNNLGVALGEAGEIAQARAQYEEALRLKPDYAEACNNLGMILERSGQPAEAVARLEEAVRFQPDYAEAYLALGNALVQTGHLAQGIEAFERALRLKPGNQAEVHNNWGSALFNAGDAQGAITHYEAALRADSRYVAAHFNLANTFARIGRLEDAINQYEATLQLKPDYVGAQVNFGITLGLAGREPEAVACFEAALQLDPDSFEAHVNLANSLTRIGRLNEAIVQYEAALRLRPGDAAVRDSLRRARAEMH